jgi:hypothetical protein
MIPGMGLAFYLVSLQPMVCQQGFEDSCDKMP